MMRKRWRKSWLWTMMVTGVWLPYAAHSRPAGSAPLASANALSVVEAQGAASLHQAVGTAWQAAAAVEAAHSMVQHVTHSTDPKDALADCQLRWGQDLGPVLCPAMFREGADGQAIGANVEGRLLQALWHLAGRQAVSWYQSGRLVAASVWTQMQALHGGDEAP